MDNSIILAICMSVLSIMILLLFWRWRRRKAAIEKVKGRTDEEKLKDINDALEIYGFLFDIEQDIVYSSLHPPQRKLGYCSLYDELAPSLNMIIDCEPIYFEYGGKRWLIEFWKGQYGMTTGGEVGVYATGKKDVEIPDVFTGTFYESVSDKYLLQMKYILKKNDNQIIEREERHWWLTGFDVGLFSKPEELSLKIEITFPYLDMQRAFIDGLYYAGYKANEIKINGRMVKLVFTSPKTKQPQKYSKFMVGCIQLLNRFYCNLFNWVTKDFTRAIDKIDFLRSYYPILFKLLANDKKAKKLENLYRDIQDFLDK